MGTDIYGRLRYKNYKNEYEYVELPPALEMRHYDFFTIIADVRNGYGFAETLTTPITSKRGLLDESIDSYGDTPDGFWYGDHSHTHVTLQDLLDTNLHYQTVIRRGYIKLEDFLSLKDGESPTSWNGDVCGQTVRKISSAEPHTLEPEEGISYYVYYEWEDQPFIEKIEQLKSWMSLYIDYYNEPKDVILFMGFDS